MGKSRTSPTTAATGTGGGQLRHRKTTGGGGHYSGSQSGSKMMVQEEEESWTIDNKKDGQQQQQQQQEAESSTQTQQEKESSSSSSYYSLTPLIQVHPLLRLDVGPFLVLYSLLIGMDYYHFSSQNHDSSSERNGDTENNDDFSMQTVMTMVFVATLTCHLSLVLSTQWSVLMKVVVGYRQCYQTEEESKASSNDANTIPNKWTHCYVQTLQAVQGAGEAAGIVPVLYTTNNNKSTTAICKFHDLIFRCSAQQPDDDVRLWMKESSSSTKESKKKKKKLAASFRPLYYPIDLPLSFYASYQGHASLQQVATAERVYGSNETRLELPTLPELLSEQVVAPFFLFQTFCVLLWSLDEYWMYALFTLVALLVFETTVAYNRLQSLQRLHRAGQNSTGGRDGTSAQTRVWVRRGSGGAGPSSSSSSSATFSWLLIPTTELVPGDWIALSNATVVPADILLLSGTAVCDEALLTGESIPQLKQALDLSSSSATNSARLDLQDNLVKESILFGGTNLLVASSSSEEENDSSTSSSSRSSGSSTTSIPPAPPTTYSSIISGDDSNKGAAGVVVTGMVLRTGFETAQGSLLRTMAHSSRNADGIHTLDTFVFILILVACAIFAASMVLQAGWNDDRRNAFRLLLHVIMIITSVVPPELPMELSLAVTSSVAALMHRCRVYCTEHFRIPWAGEVQICCFDKTGTLTSDEMRLRGVRLFDHDDEKELENLNGNHDDDDDDHLVQPDDDENGGIIPWETMRIMVGCHALALAGSKQSKKRGGGSKQQQMTVGNPLEQAVLLKTGYQLAGNNLVVMVANDSDDENDEDAAARAAAVKPAGYAKQIKILHRFAFSSKLKRMTVLAMETSSNVVWALTKGAPETIKEFLTKDSIPDTYDQVSFHHMSLGRRVLAMAYRKVSSAGSSKNKNSKSSKSAGWERQDIEQDLIFAGFLVLDCPVKSDSKSVITELRKSGHTNVMITGDAILTAAEVARQVGIVPRRPSKSAGSSSSSSKKQQRSTTTTYTYRIQPRDSSSNTSGSAVSHKDVLSNFECVLLAAKTDNSKSLPLSRSNLADLIAMKTSGNASFCISGDCLVQIALAAIGATKMTKTNDVTKTTTGARVSTNEEKSILLNPTAQAVLTKLVPLISVFARHAPHQKEAVLAAFNHCGFRTLMVGDGTNDVGALKRAHVGISIISAPQVEAKQRNATAKISKIKAEQQLGSSSGGKQKKKKKAGKPSRKQAKSLEESLQQLREAQDELDHVDLGDASVAAPFLSRTVSIKCVKEVIQQGRCTLVTILQIYKILGINCLVNAMVLSKLFLHGVKQGDRQLTFLGIAVAGLFYFVTRAEPLGTLSPCRPPASVLCIQALLSISLQFGIHFAAILLATEVALAFVDPYDPSLVPDGPFNPNVLNSCTFLLTCLATINTFAVNYRGRPFMCDLHENKLLYRSLLVCYAVLTICCLEIFPPLNDLLQLTTLPSAMNSADGYSFSGDVIFDSSQQHALILTLVKTMDFPVFMFGLMVVDTILAFAAERLVLRLFP